MKYPSVSVICQASCLADLSGFSRASCLCPAWVHHPVTHYVRDPVPELSGAGFEISHPIETFILVSLVPAIEGAARNIQLFERLADGKLGMLHQVDDLDLLCLGTTHHPSNVVSVPSKLFLSTLFFSASSATSCFNCSFSCLRALTCLLLASRFVSPTRRDFPASRKSLLQR